GMEAHPDSQGETAPGLIGGSETILLVDDDPGMRRGAERILSSYGYRVLIAESYMQALRFCEEHQGQIPLLVTDFCMPGERGSDLAARLRQRIPALGILLMS